MLDYTTLTSAVDLSSVAPVLLTVAAGFAAFYVARFGIRVVIDLLRGGK